MTTPSSLADLERRLAAAAASAPGNPHYAVPALWAKGRHRGAASQRVAPFEFYRDAVRAVVAEPHVRIPAGRAGCWTNHAVIFNMFVRSTAAFDHNQNGRLDLPVNTEGWRETGTFLKAIALLPYIRSMGVNTIHLLPITSVGSDGNKGTLGSPYAIKNPFVLDPHLGEPALGLGAEGEFKAFVEGAHHLGMRVVVEFVFRTSAKDGDWVREHPDWFYWIRESVPDRPSGSSDASSYGSPLFSPEELREIKAAAEHGNLDGLIPPHAVYREMFTPPPPAANVRLVNGRYVGTLPGGTKVRIPGAFADWPPDDSQPPWGDVTYLKMYAHPDFNYIAYNTIRMYDSRLSQKFNVNTALWDTIAGIIPFYQKEFGIDGVMIDMGHALPMDLKHDMVRRAREQDPDFAFWDENFSVTQKSVQEGYNAVIGYQWSDQHHPKKFRAMLSRFATEGFPIPYFATPESHNTPRAAARKGGILYSQYAWAVGCFLPAIPFVHSGFELGETFPVNTGLDFTPADLKSLPSHALPLFSEYAYAWTGENHIVDWVAAVLSVRAKYEALIVDHSPATFHLLEADNVHIFAFAREKKGGDHRLVVLANSDMESDAHFSLRLATDRTVLSDLLMKRHIPVHHGTAKGALGPGEVVVAEF
jgi:glycosidase